MARPRKAPGDEAVQITIPKRAYDLVDGHVTRMASAALFSKGEGGLTPRELAAARSAYVAELIEDALGFEARHPVSVTVSAPAVGGAEELREVARWQEETEAALNASAPAPVKAALASGRAMRNLMADSDE